MGDFENKVAVITGGAQGIGRCIADEFRKAGATVCVIDKQPGEWFVGDLADKHVLEQFAQEVLCSDKAGFITGENICIDGGMTRQMIYPGDHGWTLNSK